MSRPWSITLRLLFATVAALGSLVLVACNPAPPDVEIGASPSIMPGSPTASQALPTETVSAGAEPTTEPIPSSDHGEGEVSPTPAEPIVSPSSESEARNVVSGVIVDLAQQLGVAEEEIAVKSLEGMQWPDTSLGCPQPGMMYAQVVTPGYRVVLEVDGQVYEAHTDEGHSVVWCEEEESAMEVPPVPGTVEPGLEGLIEMAREDLAERLSTMADEIEVLEAKGIVWPDASLGCPVPEMSYKQVPMDGALIRLQAEGKVYEYHSGGGHDPFLCEQPLKLQKDTVPQIDLLQLTPGSPND
jgi:hypothetical protein